MKILTEHIDVPNIDTIDVFLKHGGYSAVKKALKGMTPDEVTEEVKKSGLRGRGGAGFPMGMKWSFLAKPEGVPRYLVCNADESEPGTFKDHYLMWKSPHTLLEGMIVSSFALGANTSYIYVRGELMYVIAILEKAIQEAYDKGFLGKNILGSGYDLDLFVQPGGGAYICGEETALLESLEGKRGNPRNKPPFPAVKGLWQCPTVVNNVESIAATSWIINNGGDAYSAIGIGRIAHLQLTDDSVEARHLQMRVGRLERTWERNCVAIGLAQGFVEPLEATALMIVQDTVEQFIASFGTARALERQRDDFNDKINRVYDSIRDYIQMHYKLNTRTDTPYWVAARDNPNVSDSVAAILATWDEGGDLLAEITRQRDRLAYSPTSWFCILGGMGRFPKKPRRATGKHQAVDPATARKQCMEMLRYFPDHRRAVDEMAKVTIA